ncbi:MAG: hypothetical protein Q4G70_14230 [Pseudomonadota bacterium]|nr:hypothetical protein [Pseudomonadota bacterium]
MQHTDPMKELRDIAVYLQKTTGHILTHQEFQKKQFEAQSQRHEQQIRHLTQSAQSLSASASGIVSEASKGIREQTEDAISKGVGQEFGRIRDDANPVLQQLRSAVAELAHERAQLARDRRKFVWIGLACLGVGSVLAAMGSGAYSWAKLRESAQAQQSLGHLRALSALDTARCGSGYCASVDLKNKIEHNGKTYYRIRPRAPE